VETVVRLDGSVSCRPCWTRDQADFQAERAAAAGIAKETGLSQEMVRAHNISGEGKPDPQPSFSREGIEENTRHRQRLDYGAQTNADLAQDARHQIRHIAATLGILDTSDGGFSIERACKGDAIKSDLWAILDLLRDIKTAARDHIENSKTVGRDHYHAQQDSIFWFRRAELAEAEVSRLRAEDSKGWQERMRERGKQGGLPVDPMAKPAKPAEMRQKRGGN